MTAVAAEFRRAPRPGSGRSRPARVGAIRWFSGRSLLLHLTVVTVTPVCVLAGWWQLHRALSGNTLSFVYVFEWPAFAGVALWAWWALLTAPTRDHDPAVLHPVPEAGPATPGGDRDALVAARTAPLRWDTDAESTRLRAYNAYLAELPRRPGRGRPPRRPPGGRRA